MKLEGAIDEVLKTVSRVAGRMERTNRPTDFSRMEKKAGTPPLPCGLIMHMKGGLRPPDT